MIRFFFILDHPFFWKLLRVIIPTNNTWHSLPQAINQAHPPFCGADCLPFSHLRLVMDLRLVRFLGESPAFAAISGQIIATSHEFWAHKLWFSKGIPLISGKSRLVKYYIIWPVNGSDSLPFCLPTSDFCFFFRWIEQAPSGHMAASKFCCFAEEMCGEILFKIDFFPKKTRRSKIFNAKFTLCFFPRCWRIFLVGI